MSAGGQTDRGTGQSTAHGLLDGAGAEPGAGLWAGAAGMEAHVVLAVQEKQSLTSSRRVGHVPGTSNFLQLLQQNLPELICQALNP